MDGGTSGRWRVWIVVLVGGLALAACGGDDGGSTDLGLTPADADAGGDELTDEEFMDNLTEGVDDSDLLVPRDYLQGEWCDSDGMTWSIEGEMARFGDGSGGEGQVPLAIAFIDSPDGALVSQSDDEFVIEVSGGEVTFTRGAC